MARGQRLRPPPVEDNADIRGNSLAAEFGGSAAVDEATGTRSGGFTAGITPSKASAAPVAGTENLFTGLCAALNQFQAQLVKDKKREIPDQYVIEFAPSALGESTIKRPGDQNKGQAPMQNNATAKKLDPAINKLNLSAMTWPVTAGSQIVQVIDNVMRVSSFITDQQIVQVSPVPDPVTGVQKQVPSPGTGKPMAWFKISVAAEPLGKDNIINDFAYRMTFIVSPYQPAQMISQYYPDSKYRGVHKSYRYWFTGQNTQILSYEQKYDNAYRIALTGTGANLQKKLKTDWRDQNRKIYVATSENHAQGAKDYANEPGDNAASFLYDPKSLSTVKMRIVGDPAWLQQGECGLGVSARTFNFAPFTPDGTINFDASAIMFDVSFNQPVDYDFNTGIMNTNAMNRQGLPQEHYTFTAIECKSTFSKGKFEQELTGKLVTDEIKASTNAGTGRPAATPTVASASRTTGTPTAGDSRTTGTPNDGSLGSEVVDETGQVSTLRRNEYGDLYDPAGTAGSAAGTAGSALPVPQPAAPPEPPTSPGDIESNAGPAGSGEVVAAPPNASAAPTNNNNIDDQAARAVRNQALADAAAAAGDLYAAAFYNRNAQNNRENAAANARTAAQFGVTTTPQQIAKDE